MPTVIATRALVPVLLNISINLVEKSAISVGLLQSCHFHQLKDNAYSCS
jgi:hypothetical protein